MASTVYDYAIIGAGAGGLHLAMAFAADPFFRSKRLLIIEKKSKGDNYPTWCFWEKGSGKWNDIVARSWNKTAFINKKVSLDIDLGAYTYKMVYGKDFYQLAKNKFEGSDQIKWIQGEVYDIKPGQPVQITTTENITYLAGHVFDSRVDPEFFKESDGYTYLKQHFEGWVIETKKDVFDPDVFTMMDYRLIYPGTTSFTYILPFESNKALVEYTFFSPTVVENKVYEHYLKKYIHEILQVAEYNVVRRERGVIPMTDYPFQRTNNTFVTKIGTAGGWVKGSTGYSFKCAERKSQKILENIKSAKLPGFELTKKRFRIYDALFLDVLNKHNEFGPALFKKMYHKNDIEVIFRFLDEETTFDQELGVMSTFDKLLFTKSLIKLFFNK